MLQQVHVTHAVVPVDQMPDQVTDEGAHAREGAEKGPLDHVQPVDKHHASLKERKP